MRVAFLHFDTWKKGRHANADTFWGSKHFGPAMLRDVLRKGGQEVSVCTPDTAHQYDVVLVSMTSFFDLYSLLKAVGRHPHWQPGKRTFTAIAGGFGMQNPVPLFGFIDHYWFGRAEDWIKVLVKERGEISHPSLMHDGELRPVTVHQATQVYEDPVAIDFNGKKEYRETMLGCRHKCMYCHYTFARKHVSEGPFIYNELGSMSDELEWCDGELYDPMKPHVITAMDGWSQRLRYANGRRLPTEGFQEFFRTISRRTHCSGVLVKLYNIVGQETETLDDYYEFVEGMVALDGDLKAPVTVEVQNTPLNPSSITPAAYARIDFTTNYRDRYAPHGLRIFEGARIKVRHTPYWDSPYMHLCSVLTQRYTERWHDVLQYVLWGKHKNSIEAILEKHPEVLDLGREYTVDEQLPTWFLSGYIPNASIAKMRGKMKEWLARPYEHTVSAQRKHELDEMVQTLNIIGARGLTAKQKRVARYEEYLKNL